MLNLLKWVKIWQSYVNRYFIEGVVYEVAEKCEATLIGLVFNPLTAALKPYSDRLSIMQQYGDWYTSRWWVGCYIWYSEEEPGLAAAPPSPFIPVPHVAAHPSTAVYQLHIIRCGTIITFAV